MVRVVVGQQYRIEPPDAEAAQRWRHQAFPGVVRVVEKAAGIDKAGFAICGLQQDGIPLAHAERRYGQPRFRREKTGRETEQQAEA